MGHSADIWMPLYIGDYLASTQHLTAEQSGAYLHLLMHQWKTGPLPLDREVLRRVARVERDAWGNAWAMLEQFFTRTEAGYIQNRLEREKAISQEKQATTTQRAKAAAAKRWPAKTTDAGSVPEHPSSIAQAMPEQCPSPSPSPSPSHTAKEQKPLAVTALALPAIDVFLTVTLNDGSEFAISEAKVSEWIPLYPGIDVRQQLRSYKAWAINSPTQRKTRSGISKSINFWLAKAQNASPPMGGSNGNGGYKGKTESSLNAAHAAIAIIRERGEAERNRAGIGEAGYPAANEVGDGRLLGAG